METAMDFVAQIQSILQTSYTTEKREQLEEMIAVADRIFLIGNGGSAAVAEHLAVDFAKRCGISTFTLSSVPFVTCLANDYGFKRIFANFIRSYDICEDDLLIVMSSSGRSENILETLLVSESDGVPTVFICGFDGPPDEFMEEEAFVFLKESGLYIHFDSHNYGVVEIATEIILHQIVEKIVAEEGE